MIATSPPRVSEGHAHCEILRCFGQRFFCTLLAFVLLALADGTIAAEWGCHAAKPGHPTAEERVSFIREIGDLAVKAEMKHGVPASVLAALAIAESSYGWTRLSLQANNLFGWKFTPSAAAEGHKPYTPPCGKGRRGKARYVMFASKGDAFDHVAGRLATLEAYRDYTEAYKAARARGAAAEPAAKAWLSGIASRYSGKPAEFTRKITRIMNDPVAPSDRVSSHNNLHDLSAKLRSAR